MTYFDLYVYDQGSLLNVLYNFKNVDYAKNYAMGLVNNENNDFSCKIVDQIDGAVVWTLDSIG